MKTTTRITATAVALALAGTLAACSQPAAEPTPAPEPTVEVTVEPTQAPEPEPTIEPTPEPEPVVLGPEDKLTDEQKESLADDLERLTLLTEAGVSNSPARGALQAELDAIFDETGQQVLVVLQSTTPDGVAGEWLAMTRAGSDRWLEIGKATVSNSRKDTKAKAKAWAKAQPDTWTVLAVPAS